MSVEKLMSEYKVSISDNLLERKPKIIELKKALLKSEKEFDVDSEMVGLLKFLLDRISEGKKLSIIEETELYNVTEAAKILGVTRPTIYKMLERGDIQSVDYDGKKEVVPASVVAFLKRKEFSRVEALKKARAIENSINEETKNLIYEHDSEADFEEIDL
jgi:excisionase family DNA binding protein